MRILFVCTGNMCRSPAAEGLCHKLAAELGVAWVARSAGTGGWWDHPAKSETVEAALERGVDLSEHRCQPVTDRLVEESDVTLGMAWRHVERMRALWPELADRIHLFKPWCEGRPDPAGLINDDIADPVGEPIDAHRTCVQEIEALLRTAMARAR